MTELHGTSRRRPVATLVSAGALRLASALVVVGATAGCTSTGDSDNTRRDAAIYGSVIEDLADQVAVDIGDSGDVPVVFIEPFDPDDVPLEVQVEVLEGFVDQYEIRFIDERDEAIDADLDGQPVRPGGLLIGLGPIIVDDVAEVRSELYLSADDVRAYRYTLIAGTDGRWGLASSPEVIEPAGFAPEP